MRAFADRRHVALIRHLAFDAPVEVLVLEEEDWVRVLDRRGQIRALWRLPGVAGQTHLRPGMCANEDSGFCE